MILTSLYGDVRRVLRHRGEHKKAEIYVEFEDPNKSKQRVSLFDLALHNPIPILKYNKSKKLQGKNPLRILVRQCSEDPTSNLVRAFEANVRPVVF